MRFTAAELREQYTNLGKEMRGIVENAEEEDRGLTSEEQTKFDEGVAKQDELAARIERLEKIEGAPPPGPSDEQREGVERIEHERRANGESHPSEYSRLSLADHVNGIRAWMLGEDATDEQRALAERCGYRGATRISIGDRNDRAMDCEPIESRAQAAGTSTTGGFTVADEMMGPLTERRERTGGMRRAPTFKFQTDTGAEMPWPYIDDVSNDGLILGENVAGAEIAVAVEQRKLNAYKVYSGIVLVSSELLQDSAFSWDALLGRLLSRRIARGENSFFTTGTGSNQPTGLVTVATNSAITTGGATTITYANMTDLAHAVDPDYREGIEAGYMCNDTTLAILKKIVDGDGRPLWEPSLQVGAPGMWGGHVVYLNQAMPSGTGTKAVAFGDLSEYVIRDTRGVEFRRTEDRYWENDQTGFMSYIRTDGNLIDRNAVAYLTMG